MDVCIKVLFVFCLEPVPSRRSRRQSGQGNDPPEDLITAPRQSRSSRRQRTINYNDQDVEDLNLVPGPLLQENNQELEALSSDDTVNMPRFLLNI